MQNLCCEKRRNPEFRCRLPKNTLKDSIKSLVSWCFVLLKLCYYFWNLEYFKGHTYCEISKKLLFFAYFDSLYLEK